MKKTAEELRAHLSQHVEWFCTNQTSQQTTPLMPNDWSLESAHNRLLFLFWGERGMQTLTVLDWQFEDGKLYLTTIQLTGAHRQQQTTLVLAPRVSVAREIESLRAARIAALGRLVELVRQTFPRAIVLRASLSRGAHAGLLPGREARIVCKNTDGAGIALTGTIDSNAAGERPGSFLSSALMWFMRVSQKIYFHRLLLVASETNSEELARLVFLLRENLSRAIEIYEINESRNQLTSFPMLTRERVFAAPPGSKIFTVGPASLLTNTCVERIVALAPEAIDVVRARHGATLRFHGLSFARVRRVMNHEAAWFGISREHQTQLTEATWPDLVELVESLKLHRHGHATDQRHAFFADAAEAWLESLLRRNITRLDPNLIASPLYAQLRALSKRPNNPQQSRPIDLFGLRHDGRLVLIELKVTEDRDMVLQGVDYWRRIYTYHQAGHLQRACLFGDAQISSAPPLVYLVAPILRFHRAFQTLASAVAPEIELYRFDLNEDWRAGVRVERRTRVN